MPIFHRLAAIALTLCLAGCDSGEANAISGTIQVPAGVHLGESDTLFISARAADGPPGPPLAVLKLVGMTFPLHYTLSQEDVIMPGQFFSGQVTVTATLRKSGLVNVPVPGDLRGSSAKPVAVGATGVDIQLAPER